MNKALEDLQAGRDPFAHQVDEDRGADFYLGLAKASLVVPILTAVLCSSMGQALKGMDGTSAHWARLGTLGLTGLLLLVSLILGIISLTGARTYGSEGIVGKTLWGMGISVVLVGLIGTGYLQGLKNRGFIEAVHNSTAKMEADLKKDLQAHPDGVQASDQVRRIAEVQSQMEAAAQGASGDAALIAKASSAYLQKMQAVMLQYARASKTLEEHPVLNMRGVTNPKQLDVKRQNVMDFQAANEMVIATLTGGEKVFRTELEKQRVPPEQIESALAGYRRQSAKAALSLKIREQDRVMGSAMLGALDLLASNWGRWNEDEQRHVVRFDDGGALQQYNNFVHQIKAAAADQKRLQAQLAAMLQG